MQKVTRDKVLPEIMKQCKKHNIKCFVSDNTINISNSKSSYNIPLNISDGDFKHTINAIFKIYNLNTKID